VEGLDSALPSAGLSSPNAGARISNASQRNSRLLHGGSLYAPQLFDRRRGGHSLWNAHRRLGGVLKGSPLDHRTLSHHLPELSPGSALPALRCLAWFWRGHKSGKRFSPLFLSRCCPHAEWPARCAQRLRGSHPGMGRHAGAGISLLPAARGDSNAGQRGQGWSPAGSHRICAGRVLLGEIMVLATSSSPLVRLFAPIGLLRRLYSWQPWDS
jgi:hypothetical protein